LTELEIKIIKFLLSSAVYSENAIMKNLGIDKSILDKSFKILEDNGYLESYEDFIKISFRSKEDVDVNQFARKYFNGGGHINAAGGKYLKSLEETVSDFKKIVEKEGI